MTHKLTPYLRDVYAKVNKLRQEQPDKTLEALLKQIGASPSSYWRACKLISKTDASSIPVKKAVKGGKAVLAAVTPGKVAAKTPHKPLIALIGTPEDVIASLSSMFR